MINIVNQFAQHVAESIKELFEIDIPLEDLVINPTRPEFEGDFTLVVFGLIKQLKGNPQILAEKIGNALKDKQYITDFNIVKGFLNCSLPQESWTTFVKELYDFKDYGKGQKKKEKILVEYSSPNTNKPLHLGHIRNILLGWSTAKILEENGYDVSKVQVVNDRGIAISKSMLSWQLNAQGATPQSNGVKGDKFVGDLYVQFEQELSKEYKRWQNSLEASKVYQEKAEEDQGQDAFFKTYKNEYFNAHSQLGQQAKTMLQNWEKGDKATRDLWQKMNQWVYDGMDVTYNTLGVSFDKNYYESDTYLLGKEFVQEGLEKGIFYQKEDSSIWIDLSDINMDHKLVLRSDGTSVYITQDIGTAEERYRDFKMDKMIYVVANEQDYHFQVLFEICKRLGKPYSDGMFHLSYGLVELPHGRMKTREGTVVDADDLIEEVISEARKVALEKGEISHLDKSEIEENVRKIGLGALKFFIIKVAPRKRVLFNPQDSLDLHGQTGPYVQNAIVRIKSIMRRVDSVQADFDASQIELTTTEKELIITLDEYPSVISEAGKQYDPSSVANYCYKLAKLYHRYYSETPILTAEDNDKNFKLMLSRNVAKVLERALFLLGIESPDRM